MRRGDIHTSAAGNYKNPYWIPKEIGCVLDYGPPLYKRCPLRRRLSDACSSSDPEDNNIGNMFAIRVYKMWLLGSYLRRLGVNS